MRIRTLFIFILTIMMSRAWACQTVGHAPVDSTQVTSHAIWDTLLRRHVRADGWVDYKGLVADSARLNAYLHLLEQAQPNGSNWTTADKKAFWINAYNAFTVQLVVRQYPVKSIKDIKRGIPFVNTVWDIKFIHIAGKTYDLNNIEHGILREEFKDARLHAALNCASYSCPVLRNEAFVAERLDEQLNDAMRKFINDPIRNQVTGKKARISQIFQWYRADFVRETGSIRAYLNQFAEKPLDANGRIEYIDYQWGLNDVR